MNQVLIFYVQLLHKSPITTIFTRVSSTICPSSKPSLNWTTTTMPPPTEKRSLFNGNHQKSHCHAYQAQSGNEQCNARIVISDAGTRASQSNSGCRRPSFRRGTSATIAETIIYTILNMKTMILPRNKKRRA